MKIAAFYENIHDAIQTTGQQLSDVLTWLHEAGLEMLYMTPDSWKRDREELSALMEKLGMSIEGMHWFCDFPAEPDTLRYREIIDLAVEAGARNLLIVPGMYSTGNTRRDLDSMLNGVRRAVAYGRTKNLPVLMEDYDGILAPYNCMAGLQVFLQSIEGLGCAFDTGNFVTFREDELEAFELFADRIRTVHLKDRCAERRHEGDSPFIRADGSPAYVCAVGGGEIRIAEILRRLKAGGYDGNVIVELYACDTRFVFQDMLDSILWLKEQLGK